MKLWKSATPTTFFPWVFRKPEKLTQNMI